MLHTVYAINDIMLKSSYIYVCIHEYIYIHTYLHIYIGLGLFKPMLHTVYAINDIMFNSSLARTEGPYTR
jgi:hypothetical protein